MFCAHFLSNTTLPMVDRSLFFLRGGGRDGLQGHPEFGLRFFPFTGRTSWSWNWSLVKTNGLAESYILHLPPLFNQTNVGELTPKQLLRDLTQLFTVFWKINGCCKNMTHHIHPHHFVRSWRPVYLVSRERVWALSSVRSLCQAMFQTQLPWYMWWWGLVIPPLVF